MLRISSLGSWVLLATLGAAAPAAAQTTGLPFVYDDGAGNSMPYRLFVPPSLEPGQEYPLVVFLHGLGECGNDNLIQVTSNINDLIAATQGDRFTSFLLAPQTPCVAGYIWNGETPVRLVSEIVDSVAAQYAVDERRIYVTGLSMGGFGTFAQLSHFPERYAAAAPIASGIPEANPSEVEAVAAVIKDVPIWVFHGTVDSVVPVTWSRAIVNAMRAAGGAPRYTEYPDLNHNSWSVTYRDAVDTLYPWMFGQILRGPKARIDLESDEGEAPLEVCVSAQASEAGEDAELVSFEWTFAEGSSQVGSTACHTYDSPGGYGVRLRVTNDLGYSSESSARVVAHCPSGDIGPWSSVDIGDPLLEGAARFEDEGDVLALCAGGRPLSGGSDSVHLVYQEWSGDVELTCRVAAVAGSSGERATVGVMLRSSLAADAPFASLSLDRALGTVIRFHYRSTPGSYLRSRTRTVASTPDPYSWVRITRFGDEFIGSWSEDGLAWEEIGRRTLDELPASLVVGFIAAGQEPTDSQEFSAVGATVRDVALQVPTRPGGQIPGDANQDGILDLSDAVWVLGHLYLGASPTLPCEGGTADAPGVGDLTLLDVNVDGRVDLSDAVWTLGFLYLGSSPPVLGTQCVPIDGCPDVCP